MRALGAAAAVALAAAALAPPARAGEIPEAVVVVEAAPGTAGSEPEGAPPRFVLLKDGQAFVGGTSRLETVRLEKGEAQAVRRRVDAARRAIGRERRVVLESGGPAVRVRFGDDPPVEVALGQAPAPASPSTPPEPVSAMLAELLAFHHAGLVPYAPSSYSMRLRKGTLAGGCRRWNFAFPLEPSVGATRAVPAEQAEGWPTGALPASVCGANDERYVLTLRPLLPGEQP